MTSCNILDIQCIFVNEIFGSIMLTILAGLLAYILISGRLRISFEITIALMFPVIIILGLMIGGFQIIYAFATVLIALMIAYVFQKIIGNR